MTKVVWIVVDNIHDHPWTTWYRTFATRQLADDFVAERLRSHREECDIEGNCAIEDDGESDSILVVGGGVGLPIFNSLQEAFDHGG